MILAHNQPGLLSRLVGRLSTKDTAVFIHIDGKVDEEPFRLAVPERPGVQYLSRGLRVVSHWGSFSLITAQLNLLRAAVENLKSCDRFFLLSGVDYPACRVEDILETLDAGLDYVRVDRALDPSGHSLFDLRGYGLGLNNFAITNPRSAGPFVGKIARAIERRVHRSYPYGNIYYGSAWWCLSRPTAEFVLASSKTKAASYFRYAAIPEEMFYQTLLKNSPLSKRIAQDATVSLEALPERVHGIHYVDFPPGSPSPRTLGLSDLLDIERSGALFVRKVSLPESTPLLDTLDASAMVRAG